MPKNLIRYCLICYFLILGSLAKAQLPDPGKLNFQEAFGLYNQLAGAGYNREALPYAERCYNITKDYAASATNYYEHIASCHSLSLAYMSVFRYDAAEPLLLKAMAHYKKTLGQDHFVYLRLLSDCKVLYQGIQSPIKLLPILEEILAYKKRRNEVKDSLYVGSLIDMANIHRELNRFATSKEYYIQASDILIEFNARYSLLNLYLMNNYAIYCELSGDPKSALYYSEQALQVAKVIYHSNDLNLAGTMLNLSRAYIRDNQSAKADSVLKASLKIYEWNRNNTSAKIWGDRIQANYITAVLYLIENYTVTKIQQIRRAEVKATAGGDRDEEMEALARKMMALRREMVGANHSEYANTLVVLANFYVTIGRATEAAELYKEALKIREKIFGKEHHFYLGLLFGACEAVEQSGDVETAIEMYREYVNLNIAMLKNNFFTQAEGERLNYAITLEAEKSTLNAFVMRNIKSYPEIAELALNLDIAVKGLSLESNIDIRNRVLKSGNDSLLQVYEDWSNLRQKIAKAYTLTEAERKAQQLNLYQLEVAASTLERKMAMFKDARVLTDFSDKNALDYQALKKKLQANERCIAFITVYQKSIGKSKLAEYYAALLIDPAAEYPQLLRLCTSAQLKAIVEQEVRSSGKNYIADNIEGESLYRLIWAPLEPYLDGVKTLYLSPTGLLNKVSFAGMLCDFGSEERLIDRFNLHYLSTLRDFEHLKQKNNPLLSCKEIALWGGIDFGAKDEFDVVWKGETPVDRGAGQFTYLPGTKSEIDSINNLFAKHQDWHIQKMEGAKAREEALKKMQGTASPGILHIATHGFFFEPEQAKKSKMNSMEQRIQQQKHPLMRSGVALAGANISWLAIDSLSQKGEDGILTAYEVSNFDLRNTKLVVLSACETGRGDIDNTEGVMGLQRAFKIAGAEKMILSLWKVPDAQTSELMRYFYEAYLQSEDTYLAFAAAQRKMRRKYKNPYYWAAFVLLE